MPTMNEIQTRKQFASRLIREAGFKESDFKALSGLRLSQLVSMLQVNAMKTTCSGCGEKVTGGMQTCPNCAPQFGGKKKSTTNMDSCDDEMVSKKKKKTMKAKTRSILDG